MNIVPRIERLINDAVLFRRVKAKTEYIPGFTDVIYEELPSGVSISDPETRIDRAVVVAVGPKCRYLKPGDKVQLAKHVVGQAWVEEDEEYIISWERSDPIVFRYFVEPAA